MKTWNKDALLRASALAGIAMMAFGGVSHAQDGQAVQETEAAEDAAPAQRETITVTGSRIQRAGVDTVYPAISIGRQQLDDRAFTNLAEALRETPSFSPGTRPEGAQNTFATGQNFANFLGLGTQRTLTLVNGRRFVSSNVPNTFGATGGLQVDYNVIPSALVERIETIGVGGAPVYGSDAIAGTINVILRDDFEGVEAGGQYGWTERGGGENYQLQFTMGGNWAQGRGNTVISMEYQKQEGLTRQERLNLYGPQRPQWLADPRFARDVTGDGVTNTVNRALFDRRINIFTLGGMATPTFSLDPAGGTAPGFGSWSGEFLQFDPSGNLVTFNPGTPDFGSRLWAEGGDGYDLTGLTDPLRAPLERLIIYGQTRYDLTDNITFRADMQAANTYSEDLGNQGGFQTEAFGDNSAPIIIRRDAVRGWNPLLTQQAQDRLDAEGATQFYLHRFLNDLLDNGLRTAEQSLIRVTGGFEGDYQIAGRNWNWELSAVHGRADIENRSRIINQGRYANAIDAIELTAADLARVNATNLDAAAASIGAISGTGTGGVGDVVCRSVWQRALPASDPDHIPRFGGVDTDGAMVPGSPSHPFINGCVPLNIFGERNYSQEAKDFVTGLQMTSSDLEQSSFLAATGGDVFDLPAGPLAVSFGFETRRERAAFVGSESDQIGLGRSSPFLPTGGSYTTREYFAETLVPLVESGMGIPFVEFAELTGAYRQINNSLAGDAEVWTVGGRYSPIEDLTFRGNYTESIRAPSLVELFAPQVSSFSFAADPCDNRNVNTGPNPSIRRANCVADLGAGYDPDTFVSDIVAATARGATGGNTELENEKAESYTFGLTWEPRFFDGFLVTTDYINVKIIDAITSVNLSQLMRACYDSSSFPTSACNSFTRDGGNQVIDFLTGQANAAQLAYESVNATISYNFDVAEQASRFMDAGTNDWGNLTLAARVNRTITRDTSVVGENPQNTIGGFDDPKWAATFDASWVRDNLRLFWRVNWRDAVLVSPANLSYSCVADCSATSGEYRLDSGQRWIHNASVAYSFGQPFDGAPQNTIIQFNVNNVFDRQPDEFQWGHGHFDINEQLGRNFVVRLRAQY